MTRKEQNKILDDKIESNVSSGMWGLLAQTGSGFSKFLTT